MTIRGGKNSLRTVITSNASQAVLAMIALDSVGKKLAGDVTVAETIRLKELIQDNAPVGPPKRSGLSEGHYKRSIHYRTRDVKTGKSGTVFSTADYGRRLEFGFSGMREKAGAYFPPGRYYEHWETSPAPHWQPMVDKVEKGLEDKYAAAMRKAERIVAARFPS